MDPNDLRARIEEAIRTEIEPEAWERCAVVEKAERDSLRSVLDAWKAQKLKSPKGKRGPKLYRLGDADDED
jgi:hypothetical protein